MAQTCFPLAGIDDHRFCRESGQSKSSPKWVMPQSDAGRYHTVLMAAHHMTFSAALKLSLKLALKSTFFRIYSLTLAVIFGYPLLLESANYAIPEKAELTVMEGEIVEVSGRSPHITLMLKGQHILKAEFPVQSFAKREGDIYLFYPLDRAKVQRCKKVSIRGQFFKYYPLDLLRIWEVECLDNSFRVTYESVVNYWSAKRNYLLIPKVLAVLFFVFLFPFFLALDARRRQREASSEVPLR